VSSDGTCGPIPLGKAEMTQASLRVVPLAIVMVAGPQIISAFFLATTEQARRNSIAYVTGAGLATVVETSILFFIARGLDLQSKPSGGSTGWLDYVIAALIVVAGIRVFRRREVSEPPKWMGRLSSATPGFSFRLGFFLFVIMPTDILTMTTVAMTLARDEATLLRAIPFYFVTVMLIGTPLMILLLLGDRAESLLPRIRAWMSDHSWIVSESVLVIFLILTLG
jgi:hypothetical protein